MESLGSAVVVATILAAIAAEDTARGRANISFLVSRHGAVSSSRDGQPIFEAFHALAEYRVYSPKSQ